MGLRLKRLAVVLLISNSLRLFYLRLYNDVKLAVKLCCRPCMMSPVPIILKTRSVFISALRCLMLSVNQFTEAQTIKTRSSQMFSNR